MKFGNISTELIDELSFSLVKDPSENRKHLESGTPGKIYVGCGKWGRPEWVGNLFPEGTKEKEFLSNYVNHFNSIELNSTFYTAKRDNIESWALKADDDFKFCPKFPRMISHLKRLKNVEDFTDYFVEVCGLFGNSLGTTFLQLAENYGPKNIEYLAEFLERIPNDFSMALEVRHKEWFYEENFEELVQLTEKNGVSLVVTDTGLRRDAVHMRLTCPIAFVRFNGYLGHKTDFSRLDEWAERSMYWINSGLKELYFFMHQDDEIYTPSTAKYFIDKITELGGSVSKSPKTV